MPSPNEFWLCLHELACAGKAEGQTHKDRLANILDTFQKMPASAQREIRSDLVELLTFLPDVYSLVKSTAGSGSSSSAGAEVA